MKKNKPIIKELLSSRRIYTILAVCCGISIILGTAMTIAAFVSYRNDEDTFRELADAAHVSYDEKEEMVSGGNFAITDDNIDTEDITDESNTSQTAENESGESSPAEELSGSSQNGRTSQKTGVSESPQVSLSSLKKLMAQNSDCIGWLRIEGTNLDYPVMLTPDEPLKYINKNFYGKKSSAGVPFLDGRCDLTNSDNLIFYGHRMKNGTMFSCLKKYTSKKYFDKHPTIEFTTSDGVHQFNIFAVITTTKTDSWYCFTKFVGEDEFKSVVNLALSKSLYDTGLRPEYGTRLISLSSCYGSGKNGRIIVIGMEEN